jgi:mRNA interferase MazF
VKQYELWWAEMPPPVGRRPVLLLSRTPAVSYLNKLVVAEITTTVRGIPQEVALGPPEGLAAVSVANLDNVHVVPKRVLVGRIGALAASRVRDVKVAVGFAFDWPELKASA